MDIFSKDNVKNWRGVKTRDAALERVRRGILLSWRDMRTIKKNFSKEDHVAVVRQFAKLFSERVDMRLPQEIIVESLLIWIANTNDDELITEFLGEILSDPDREKLSWALVELSLTSEIADMDHNEDIYAAAVSVICELGLSINYYHKQDSSLFQNPDALLDHVATYLLSVSNSNDNCVRLSLVHYFGEVQARRGELNSFNRIMGRFGHTVLGHLFNLLFKKRTEAVALQFVLENLPNILLGDRHVQKIVHENFKSNMLKSPERFSLFLQTFSDYLLSEPSLNRAARVYCQHLAALLAIVSEVSHHGLGRELIVALMKFEGQSYCDEIIDAMVGSGDLRDSFQGLILTIQEKGISDDVLDSSIKFRQNKRGRKPSFAKVEKLATRNQVYYLGNQETPRAS